MTEKHPKVIAVIPAYNEQPFIGEIVSQARKYVDQVIVIDDGSNDSTGDAASAAGANVIRHSSRRGAGAATKTGFEAALKNGADIVVTLDGDGQHNPDEIPRVIAPVANRQSDLVIGSRFLLSLSLQGAKPRSNPPPYNVIARRPPPVIARQSRSNLSKTIPRYRKFGIDVITFLYNFGSKAKVSDAQSCFRAHSRKLLEALNLTEDGFGFSVQVLIQARNKGFPITEIPISCVYHSHASSSNPVVHGLGVAWDVIKLRLTPVEWLKQILAPPLYTNALYLMANTIAMAFLNFVFWVVVARLYSTADVGFASAVISAAMVLIMLSSLGFDSSLIRFLPQSEKPHQLSNTTFTIGGLVGFLSATIFLAGISLWSPALNYLKENLALSLIFVLLVVLWTISSLAGCVFIAHRRAKFTFLQNNIHALLKIPLVILLSFFFYSFGIIGALTIAIAVTLALVVFLFLPRVQAGYRPVPALSIPLVRDTWKYSGGNYLVSLVFSAFSWFLPLLVVNVLGAEANAYFYISLMIASLLFFIPGAVSSSLFAEGSYSQEKLTENIVRSLKFTSLLLVPSIAAFLLFGKWLLLVFGESYSIHALKLLQLLTLSALPLGVNLIYSTVLRVTGRLRELITVWGFIVITILATSYFLMPTTGITGIGYAWLGAHSAVTLYALSSILNLRYNYKKDEGFSISWRQRNKA